MKTWDVLNRDTGSVVAIDLFSGYDETRVEAILFYREVAYCRETGEVVYR